MIKRCGSRGSAAAPESLNFSLNLRSWASATKFKGEKPWLYPAPDKPDPVAADKPTFGEANSLVLLGKKGMKSAANKPTEKYIRLDPESRYSDKYRIKNISEVRKLVGGKPSLPSLHWCMNLRSTDTPQLAQQERINRIQSLKEAASKIKS